MNIDLQADLFRRYPHFFRKPRTRDDAAPLDFRGIECGDGWFGLVDGLAQQFETHILSLISQQVPAGTWPRASQLKEKFGTLNVHIQNQRHAPSALVQAARAAEEASEATCETCGSPGLMRKTGYFRVICDECLARPVAGPSMDYEAVAVKLKQLLDARSHQILTLVGGSQIPASD